MSATGQAIPGTSVPNASLVTPAGAQGPQGIQGPGGAAIGGVPTGCIFDYAGSTAPPGYVMVDGSSYSTTGAMANLFAVIGYTFGGSGGTFNVPDGRGRAKVGAGQGTGLTARSVGDIGGEEKHALITAELAAHNHTISISDPGTHVHGHAHTHTLGNHVHGMDHYHNIGAGFSHSHGLNAATHAHAMGYALNAAGGSGVNSLGGTAYGYSTDARATGDTVAAASLPAGSTVYASQTNSGWVNTGGPSTNTSDGASTANTAGAGTGITASSGNNGSGVAHNTMMPFIVYNQIIKT